MMMMTVMQGYPKMHLKFISFGLDLFGSGWSLAHLLADIIQTYT
jgi:hypothetical protein